jgi:hypothetical protein
MYGVIICAVCHPPAVDTLVARWLDPDGRRRAGDE